MTTYRYVARRKATKQGFTLVEIMIVVAIMGVLAAVGIPSFKMARGRSLDKTKVSNVRTLNHAVQVWSIETLQLDTSPIGAGVADYIAGGLDSLAVGNVVVTLEQITSKTVAYTFTVNDLYGSSSEAAGLN